MGLGIATSPSGSSGVHQDSATYRDSSSEQSQGTNSERYVTDDRLCMVVYYFLYVPGILITLMKVDRYRHLPSPVNYGHITTNRRFSQYLMRVREAGGSSR